MDGDVLSVSTIRVLANLVSWTVAFEVVLVFCSAASASFVQEFLHRFLPPLAFGELESSTRFGALTNPQSLGVLDSFGFDDWLNVDIRKVGEHLPIKTKFPSIGDVTMAVPV